MTDPNETETKPEAKIEIEAATKLPNDIEVALFLTEFRSRTAEQQESSPVWQELTGFPQWAGAQYRGDEPPTMEAPPDPRLPPLERRAILEAQAAANPQLADPHTPRPGPDPNVITTGAVGGAPNPWSDFKMPAEDGSAVFLNCNTDVRPHFPGDWQRRSGGWFRPATV